MTKEQPAAAEAAQQAINALEAAKNGLEWYRDNCVIRDGSDDEMDAQIDAAILALAVPAQAAAEPMRKHVEDFATKVGWKRGDDEGAFEFVQRISYEQGLHDEQAAKGPDPYPEPAQAAAVPEAVGWYEIFSDGQRGPLQWGAPSREYVQHLKADGSTIDYVFAAPAQAAAVPEQDAWHDTNLPPHGPMPFSFIGLSAHAKEAAREYAEIYAREALAAACKIK